MGSPHANVVWRDSKRRHLDKNRMEPKRQKSKPIFSPSTAATMSNKLKIPNKGTVTAHIVDTKTKSWKNSECETKSFKVQVVELRDNTGGKVGNLVGDKIHQEGETPTRISLPKNFTPEE